MHAASGREVWPDGRRPIHPPAAANGTIALRPMQGCTARAGDRADRWTADEQWGRDAGIAGDLVFRARAPTQRQPAGGARPRVGTERWRRPVLAATGDRR
jgi:hypothetical protein